MPFRYKEKEFEIRKILNDRILRGKVDCYITLENLDESSEASINHDLVKNYMTELQKIASDGPDFEYLKMAIRMPETISTKTDDLKDSEWNFLKEILVDALTKFDNFRKTEGEILHEELERNIKNIGQYLSQVEPFEDIRLDAVKEKYRKTLQEFDQIDETRFYQEMAYYTEKLDIAEEKVRLTQHLKYYTEVMNDETFNGKN